MRMRRTERSDYRCGDGRVVTKRWALGVYAKWSDVGLVNTVTARAPLMRLTCFLNNNLPWNSCC